MKRFLSFTIAFLLFGGVAMADFISHPQYAKITTFTQSVVGTIKTYQDQFFVANGRYFQGLWLLGPVQVDGTTDITVVNTSAPSDFPYTWKDFAPTVFKNTLKIPVNIRIDVYQSPDGWGWIFTAEVWKDGLGPDLFGAYGDHWMYIHDEGPNDGGMPQDVWFIMGD